MKHSLPTDPLHNTGTSKRRTRNLLTAIHPLRIPESNLRFTHTFGLGGMALTVVLLLVFTGILLRFHYEPNPAGAYDSILFMQRNIIFGQLIRNVHHWSGIFLIVISFLHLLRVFLTGAFLPPRHWNWVIGIGLFLGVIFINFTGYLLPWDQLAYWAVTVSTSMLEYVPLIGESLKTALRGGSDVGTETLANFYTFHTAVIPGLLTILLVWHFYKVRKNGGVILPRNADKTELKLTDSFPHLVNREMVTALALTAFILLFSLALDAPLQEKANPAFSPNPAKSPWYFQGFQELLLHFHPTFAVFIIPMILLIGFTFFPFLKFQKDEDHRDFTMMACKPIMLWSAITGLVVTFALILLDEFLLHYQEKETVIPSWLSEGLFPLLVLAGLTYGFILLIRKKFSKRMIDKVLALFILFSSAYIVLMLVGTFLRGEGMKLIF
jgi:quinol-cytochrome oxidoreductase complex cytochrome b subunit